MTTALEAFQQTNVQLPIGFAKRYFQQKNAELYDLDERGREDDEDEQDDEQDTDGRVAVCEASFTDGKRRVRAKPKCNLARSMTPWRNFTILRKKEAAFDAWVMPSDGIWVLPLSRRRMRPRSGTASELRNLYNLPKRHLDDAPEAALMNRNRIEGYNVKCPANENPDSRGDGNVLIPNSWEKPDKQSTKHADIPDNIKAVLLDYYRAHRDSNEPEQTNFFYGDNDNAPKGDGESSERKVSLPVLSDWEVRPSVSEIMVAASGVQWSERPAFIDSMGKQRQAMVVPCWRENDVTRDLFSRTVNEIEWQKRADKHTEKMSAKDTLAYARDNRPAYTPPIRQLGKFSFCTSDHDAKDSRHRGELLTIQADSGVEHSARERLRKSKIVLTKEQSRQLKQAAQYRYAYLCRDNGVDPDEASTSHVSFLSDDERAKQSAEKAKHAKRWYDRLPTLKPDPAFFTSSITINAARALHNVKAANDNRIYSGLPRVLWNPTYITASKGSPLLDDGPEERLIENRSRINIQVAKAQLSSDEVLVLDSFMSSESCTDLGRKTGDEGKHERTQERNGKRRLIEVATKYASILDKMAA
jgi:hypothetical protein